MGSSCPFCYTVQTPRLSNVVRARSTFSLHLSPAKSEVATDEDHGQRGPGHSLGLWRGLPYRYPKGVRDGHRGREWCGTQLHDVLKKGRRTRSAFWRLPGRDQPERDHFCTLREGRPHTPWDVELESKCAGGFESPSPPLPWPPLSTKPQ